MNLLERFCRWYDQWCCWHYWELHKDHWKCEHCGKVKMGVNLPKDFDEVQGHLCKKVWCSGC